MPILGKEAERQMTPDEIAQREIQGYIDRVEHQAETERPQTNQTQPVPLAVVSQVQVTQSSVGVTPVVTQQKITLPLDQSEVESGLKKNVLDGIRWLSEWCLMMIKKYPGRVFYMPHQVNK